MTNTKRRITIFVGITYLLSWGMSLLIYLLGIRASDLIFMVLAMCIMFFPMIASLITRLITREGFKNLYIKPNLKKNGKTYLLAWILPTVFIIVGAIVYFLIFPSSLTLRISDSATMSAIPSDILQGLSTFTLSPIYIIAACLGALLIGPVMNFIPSFGEEFGWRGYLLPKLLSIMSPIKASIISGIIWGIWHAPLIALGLKYGFGYPFAPYSGIIAMIILCVFLGSFMNYTFIKTSSIVPAVLIHGSFNALCELPGLLVLAGANPLVGPKPIGIVGGICFLIAGVLSLIYMKKYPQKCKSALLE